MNELNLIQTGLPCFVLNPRSGPCGYRLSHDSLSLLLSHFHKRVVPVSVEDLMHLVTEKAASIGSYSEELQVILYPFVHP